MARLAFRSLRDALVIGILVLISLPAPVRAGDSDSQTFSAGDFLTGDWGGERKEWSDQGITLKPSWTNDLFGNPVGGIRHGLVDNGLLAATFEVDTKKALQWEDGGLFHANFYYIYGPNIDTPVGDASGVSSITGYNTFRMQECWYEQPFWDGKASVKAGWIAADIEFLLSDSASLFLNNTFGDTAWLALNDPYGLPAYPTAAPGVRLRLQLAKQVYFQSAVFTGSNGAQNQDTNGFDARFSGSGGVLVMNEIAFTPTFGKDDHSLGGSYKFGSFTHTGQFDTWDSQTANATTGGALAEGGTDYGLYVLADQQIYHAQERIVSLFARGAYAPANVNPVTWYTDGGIDFTGWIPGRDKDVAGIAVACSWFSPDYSTYNQAVNGGPALSSETDLEATYRIQMKPWWTLQPDLQYIFQPGGAAAVHDALVLGVRTVLQF